MADNIMKTGGGGVNKSENMPECSREYNPTTGGYLASEVEGEGELGDKMGESLPGGTPGMEVVGKNQEEGDYENQGSWPPGIPHDTADPELGGPPLAYTPINDPNKSMY